MTSYDTFIKNNDAPLPLEQDDTTKNIDQQGTRTTKMKSVVSNNKLVSATTFVGVVAVGVMGLMAYNNKAPTIMATLPEIGEEDFTTALFRFENNEFMYDYDGAVETDADANADADSGLTDSVYEGGEKGANNEYNHEEAAETDVDADADVDSDKSGSSGSLFRFDNEFESIAKVGELMQGVTVALGGGEAILGIVMHTLANQTAGSRRVLSEPYERDTGTILLDPTVTSVITGVVREWYNGLSVETERDDDAPTYLREIQGGMEVAIVQAVTCTILSIFVDNILYSQIPPLTIYEDNLVCLKPGSCPDEGPNGEVIKDIEFVSKDAIDNQFLYHNKGPESLQGVFWLNYPGYCSSMVSFAETKEPFPLSTGELHDPLLPLFPVLPTQFTYDGFVSNIRVTGASNWGFSQTGEFPDLFGDDDDEVDDDNDDDENDGNGLCYEGVKLFDLIYGIKLIGGTLEVPKKIVIVPSTKIPFTPLRVSLDDECLADPGIPFILLRFEMELIEDCADIQMDKFGALEAKAACDQGAKIWERNSWFLAIRGDSPSNTYYVIQIIDGCGEKLDPSYQDWVEYQGASDAPQPYINGFRSINAKTEKSAKSLKSDKQCKVSKRSKNTK